jgi:hypothetical protein
MAATLVASVCLTSCATGGATTTQTSSSTATNPYAAVYKSLKWGATVSVSFPSNCTMTLTTTGQPDYTPNDYYLVPAGGNAKIVAHTAVTNMALAVVSFQDTIAPNLRGTTTTLNICPTKATTSTGTNLGAIGYLISGTAMFNPFEANGQTPAVTDNASYTFTDSSGTQQTAYFLDQCDSHSNGMTWHAHGNPNCVTAQVDTSTGPSHIIGIALDGYPIYGGRDIDGNVVDPSTLDACNGISSPTPEFPGGAYHYVLPIGVNTKYASINCYAGVVSQETVAKGAAVACNMKAMFAMFEQKKDAEPKQETMRMVEGAI